MPSGHAYWTSTTPSVTINNRVPVCGARLAAGDAGLHQLAVQVPTSLGNGNWPVVATMGFRGASSPASVVLAMPNWRGEILNVSDIRRDGHRVGVTLSDWGAKIS